MKFRFLALLLAGIAPGLFGQDAVELPPDLRSHNLLYTNPSIFNPAFSTDQVTPHQVGFWTRWQWQTPDTDPTTLLVNYVGRSRDFAYGGGFFQNNTSIYRQTGGLLHYAFDIPLGETSSITFGANLFGFMQELSDASLFLEEPISPFIDDRDQFILQLSPAIQLNIDQFGLAVFSDNLFDFNVTTSGAVTESNEKIIGGMLHYTFPLEGNDSNSPTFFRPMVYVKSIPTYDTQLGLNLIWSASRYWLQGGYNSFYGPSGGLGGKFFKRLNLGAIVEYATDNAPEGEELTYELVASLDLGPLDGRKKVVGFDVEEEEEPSAEEELAAAARLDSIQRAEAAQELALQRQRDSLDAVRRAAELAEARRVQDSIQQAEEARLAREEVVVPEEGERYQEVSEAGLEPGYYLIANVFGTKRYFDAFMADLRKQGIEPLSFYREANKYNYVYLRRYDSIEEARRARNSKFGGKYNGDLWIFRVR
ncbi:type IX secretion system membrane protein, PorP/SprF family [Robiginitalea myxolifaciens]|uniref:Type IX secretion system membrane protein, PorP/SprF family n=1 Tax=Robiginitalea myxolifaciens TaxID=400055 RepID=A0A1I6GSK5_9FLAO|nr:PorP/SprF family type IX secretion system membrane protein [Robiginitalea myxolifaciens]SFR45263.1 type IX secretion system membrane protein, PorP/SprF family [Robiginitalea myxolifaciens]